MVLVLGGSYVFIAVLLGFLGAKNRFKCLLCVGRKWCPVVVLELVCTRRIDPQG